MKMLFYLLRKDFLLIHRFLLISVAVMFCFPLFVMARTPELLGFTTFLVTVIFSIYLPLQSLAIIETKYPKVASLLCAAPYTRQALVISRYIFCLVIFLLSYICYSVLSVITTAIPYLSSMDLLLTLMISSILLGIYLPLQYKLGFEKVKYILMIVILSIPFLLPTIIKNFSRSNVELGVISSLPILVKSMIMIAIVIGVTLASALLSIKIYSKKEL